MKKGFTMIELIFVIVILGILASVAIPRLSSTRLDAEISSAIANLRTIQSDVAAYYATKGHFAEDFRIMTNVPVTEMGAMESQVIIAGLKIGDSDTCLMLRTSPAGYLGEGMPAALEIDLEGSQSDATGICKQVLEAKAFTDKMPKFATNPSRDVGEDGKSIITTGTADTYGVILGSTAKIY